MNVNDGKNVNMDNVMTKVISDVEQYVDSQLEKLTLQDEDYQAIRAKRLAELKKQSQLVATWKKQGHGVFTEIRNDKELFETCKTSDDVVVYNYSKADFISPVINHHLKKICERHLETKFVKVDIDHIPFLKKKLSINDVPTILVLKNNIVKKRFVKLQPFGNQIDFETSELEWCLAQAGAIKLDDDLQQIPKKVTKGHKNIRCSRLDSDDDLSDSSDSPIKDTETTCQPEIIDLDDGNLADLEDD